MISQLKSTFVDPKGRCDYKNGVKELDEEHHYRLEKFKSPSIHLA